MKHANKVNMEFCYTSAASTNIAKTIRREQRRLEAERLAKEETEREAEEVRLANEAEAAKVVTTMTKRART